LNASVNAWYFHSTWIWLLVMGMASLLFFFRWNKLKETDPSLLDKFLKLP